MLNKKNKITKEELIDHILEIKYSLEEIKDSYRDLRWDIMGPLAQQKMKIKSEEFLRTAPTSMAMEHLDWNVEEIAESKRRSKDLRNSTQQLEDAKACVELHKDYWYTDMIISSQDGEKFEVHWSYRLKKSEKPSWAKTYYLWNDDVKDYETFTTLEKARGFVHKLYKKLPLQLKKITEERKVQHKKNLASL